VEVQRVIVPAAPQQQQQVTETAPEPVQEVPPAAEQPPVTVTDPAETATTDETRSGIQNPKHLQTAAVLERPKKPATEKPAAPVKKKVTVDDLINDN